MSREIPGWDTANQRIERINELIYELGLIDAGISDEDLVLGAMATNPVVRDMLAGIIGPQVFSDPANKWIFVHLTGGDTGHVQMQVPAQAHLKLEYFELGAVQVGVLDAMRFGRELVASHEGERLRELAESLDTARASPAFGIATPAPGNGLDSVQPQPAPAIRPTPMRMA